MLIQNRLRSEKKIDFEGLTIRYIGEWTELKPGDSYMAERNTGPKLLTVKEVKETLGGGKYAGAVYPMENEYPYDLPECVKVEIVL